LINDVMRCKSANAVFFVFLLSSVSWKAMQSHGWEDKGIGLDSYLGGPPRTLLEKKEDTISVGISHPPGVAGLIRTGFISGSPGEDIMRIFKTWILCRIPQ